MRTCRADNSSKKKQACQKVWETFIDFLKGKGWAAASHNTYPNFLCAAALRANSALRNIKRVGETPWFLGEETRRCFSPLSLSVSVCALIVAAGSKPAQANFPLCVVSQPEDGLRGRARQAGRNDRRALLASIRPSLWPVSRSTPVLAFAWRVFTRAPQMTFRGEGARWFNCSADCQVLSDKRWWDEAVSRKPSTINGTKWAENSCEIS